MKLSMKSTWIKVRSFFTMIFIMMVYVLLYVSKIKAFIIGTHRKTHHYHY
ncbi:hypothetical protein CF65_02091 [Aggregatibacter actinomycetemcomitans HK1651]|nr:hypothetical protein CF65_02091 [Aggregatibacter actinomycetemcomitans HK1651]